MASTGLRPRRTNRHLLIFAVSAWTLFVLAGCAGGNAETANEAATREAERATNVVAEIEATQVVREFFQTTVTPSPFPTMMPSLANLRLTTSLRAENAPGDTVYTFTRGSGSLYADAQIANLSAGQQVVAVWSHNGETIETSEVGIGNDHELIWIALRWDIPGSAPSGTYVVSIRVVGPGTNEEGAPADVSTEIGTLVFQVY